MNKEFIPYEQALELKELGFDEKCFGYYVLLATNKIELVLEETSKEFYKAIADSIEDTKRIPEDFYTLAPLYQQAFRWFREKYNLRYSIGNTNIAVCHIPVNNYHTTQLLQNNASYEDAELATIKFFIEKAKQL